MINYIFLFILCIIPGLILLTYVYMEDKIEKEPLFLTTILFCGGVIACIISILLSIIAKNHFPYLILPYSKMDLLQIISKTFLLIAVVEETAKWILNYILTWNNKNFNHIYDPIVYCVFVSIGFATIENIVYAIKFSPDSFIPILARSLISVPAHASFGVFMGYYLGTAKKAIINGNLKESHKYRFLSLLIPIIMHFLYDTLLIKQNIIIFIIFIIYIITLYVLSYKKINKLSKVKQTLAN